MFGKSIFQSVGLGGANRSDDVRTIQYLLNCVPVTDGGPLFELKIDGIAECFLISAIQRFQKVRFGSSDGLVRPVPFGEFTLPTLNQYDPAPGETLPHLTSGKWKGKKRGLIGGSGAEFNNHSCDPNLYARLTRGRIFLISLRRIEAGEELTLDYDLDSAAAEIRCSCGAAQCRGLVDAFGQPRAVACG